MYVCISSNNSSPPHKRIVGRTCHKHQCANAQYPRHHCSSCIQFLNGDCLFSCVMWLIRTMVMVRPTCQCFNFVVRYVYAMSRHDDICTRTFYLGSCHRSTLCTLICNMKLIGVAFLLRNKSKIVRSRFISWVHQTCSQLRETLPLQVASNSLRYCSYTCRCDRSVVKQ